MVKEGYSRINAVKFALAAATIFAAIVLLASLATITNIFGGFPILVSLISEIYGRMGYTTTYLGSALGAIYIFIDIFILTWVFALLYNRLIN
ncbi:MAG: hypothetical protein KKF50_05580 [Nanoarchaeota archaeon]|nr:hypothetical protein [Nanoarchaeota archaeon]